MFSSLMNAYKSQSAAIMRFLWGDNDIHHHDKNNKRQQENKEDEQGDLLRWVIGVPRHTAARHRNANSVDNRLRSRGRLRPTKTK